MNDPTPAIRAAAPFMLVSDVAGWAAAFIDPLEQFGLITPKRIAGLIGQCAVETGGFVELVEDMDYRAARICQVWPGRFPTLVSAIPFAHAPKKLGTEAYSNRMGNGPPSSGDGYRYRGRGLIQTTGRDAYAALAKACGRSIEDTATWMETRDGATFAACWDWQRMGCTPFADAWDIEGLSRRINGGNTALSDRVLACNAALRALGVSTPTSTPIVTRPVGSRTESLPPGHTDLMISPESLDAFLAAKPLSDADVLNEHELATLEGA